MVIFKEDFGKDYKIFEEFLFVLIYKSQIK